MPDRTGELLRQGLALHQQGRLAEAGKAYEAVLAAEPDQSDALHLLGLVALQSGAAQRAAGLIGRAVSLNPRLGPAHLNLGLALQQLKRFAEAIASYDQAIALMPARAEPYLNRGNTLQELRQFEAAVADYDQAIARNPDYVETHANRGRALLELDRCEEAIAAFDRAISLRPGFPDAHLARGVACQELGRYDEAVACFDRAIACSPGGAAAEAWSNRGAALRELGRFEDALASFDQAISLNPDLADAHKNRGFVLLQMGAFEAGWAAYEWRRRARGAAQTHAFAQPLWRGDADLRGKTILVYAEQGLGDTIQFSRYVGLLGQRGAQVLFAPQPPLRRLMRTLDAACRIVDVGDRSLAFDFHAPLLSLPLAFGTTLETIPAATPYLHAEPDRVERWRQRIGAPGFKVGVCWQAGGSKYGARRSFPLAQLLRLADVPGVRLISLQKGAGEAELDSAPGGAAIETLGADFDVGDDAFLDAAAVIACCDLVITCDTAIEHLAGALGAPVWAAHKLIPDWRWLLGRSDSPWYPTMRLFRQRDRDDWDGVLAEIEAALRDVLSEESDT